MIEAIASPNNIHDVPKAEKDPRMYELGSGVP